MRTLLFLLLFSRFAGAADTYNVRVCDGEDDWPPFTYADRINGEKTGVARGLAHRVLRESLPATWNISTTLVPWARCLRGVETGEYDLTLNVSYSEKRAAIYHYSQPYIFTYIHVFYSTKAFAQPPIQTKSDLKKLRNCGISGHNYSLVGLSSSEVDQGSDDLAAVFAKIARGRCDVFTHSIEDVEGYLLSDPNAMEMLHITHAAVSDVAPIGRYFLLSRNSKISADLMPVLNNGLDQLQRKHRIPALLDEETTIARQQLQPKLR